MKRYTVVLMCFVVVLSTSLAEHQNIHDHWNHKHKAEHKYNHHYRAYRSSENNRTCSHPNQLEIFLNESSRLLRFSNITANISIVFNYSSTLVFLLNGHNGTGFVFKGNFQNPRNFSLGNQSIENVLQNLSNLNFNGGVKSNSSVLQEIDHLVAQLGIHNNFTQTLSQLSKILNQVGNGSLNGITFGSPCLRGGLVRILDVLRGLLNLFQPYSHGLAGFLGNGTSHDLSSIINSSNGIQAFLHSLELIRSIPNLVPVFGPFFGNSQTAFATLAPFFGRSFTTPLDMYFRVISSLISTAHRQCHFQEFFSNLLEIPGGRSNITNQDLTSPLNSLLQLNSSGVGGLENLINIFQNLTRNNLSVNGTNIDSFLNSLRNGDHNGTLNATIHSLLRLSNLFNPAQTFPQFLRFVFGVFLQPGGRSSLCNNIVPGFNPQQLQNLNITSLLNSNTSLSQIPFFGGIYRAVISSLTSASNGTINLEQLINSSGGIFSLFNPLNIAATFLRPVQSIAGQFFGQFSAGVPNLDGDDTSDASSGPAVTESSSGTSVDNNSTADSSAISTAAPDNSSSDSASSCDDNETTPSDTTQNPESKLHNRQHHKDAKVHHPSVKHHNGEKKHEKKEHERHSVHEKYHTSHEKKLERHRQLHEKKREDVHEKKHKKLHLKVEHVKHEEHLERHEGHEEIHKQRE